MIIISVSGKASNVGKTTLVSHIIKNLKCQVAVIKTSIHDELEDIIVSDNPEIINENGTDTAIFKESGAENVVYLRSDYEHLEESYKKARELLDDDIEYLIIEGNSILDFISPTLIFYLESTNLEAKDSANRARSCSDIIIENKNLDRLIADGNSMTFKLNFDSISCFDSHLICKTLNIKIPLLGKLLEKEDIKIRYCQLGLFK